MTFIKARRVFIRVWIAFVAIWIVAFGPSYYSAHSEYQRAHNEAQGTRVFGNVLKGSTVINDLDPNFGEEALSRDEAAEASADEAQQKALRTLLLGLLGGSAVLVLGFWVLRAAID